MTRGRVFTRAVWAAAALVSLSALSGCAGDYVGRTRDVRRAYEASDYDRAAAQLAHEEKNGPEIDKLLVLLDRGMVLHAAGRYAESIQVLTEADKLQAKLDFVSVSEEAGTLITNERERAYRGEDFEKLMIPVLLALNYAELGKDEDALVEVRRVNERIRKMITDEKKPYEQLAIARYLGGVLYEDSRNEDSAIIDYQEAMRLSPQLGPLAEPLLRLAKRTGRDELYEELKRRYPGVDHAPLGPNEGQVVVVIEAGRSPEKESINKQHGRGQQLEVIAIPVFRDRGHPPQGSIEVEGRRVPAVTVTSISQVAKVHLDDRIGRLMARQLASTAIRAGVAAGVGAATRSEGLGILTFLLLSALNAADLRSWLSLPAEFQLSRARLPAGKHQIAVSYGGQRTMHEVEVKPGRVALLVLRRY